MVEFERPFYASTGTNVMMGGKPVEQVEADLAVGVARVGGFWRSPNYFESYLGAAKTLIDQGRHAGSLDDIGLPAFYLQRHAAELMLKSLYEWILEIRDFRCRLVDASFRPDIDKRQKDLFGHDLHDLLDRVQKGARDLDLPAPPRELDELIQKFVDIEPTETWARYSTSRSWKKGSRTIQHQVNESVIPLVELQEKLMKVSELTVSREVFGASYADELYSEWNKLDMVLEARTNG